jgi:carotenoid phi-ring synthase / carotenoid chi-ring synthase
MTENDMFPVVIIGAGIAGLAAATHLVSRGIEPLVLDADYLWLGGRLSGGDAVSFDYEGRKCSFKPDHGVHALWGGYLNMRAMIKRFTETELQPSIGEEWINRWGREVRMIEAGNAIRSRWIPAPFHYLQLLFHPQIWANIQPWDFLSIPGFLASILLTLGTDPLKEKLVWDGLTMKDYFLGWTPNLRSTFEGLGVNLLAAPKEQISLAGFIAALRFYTMLRRDSWQMDYLPSDSHSSLIQPLIDYVEGQGGAVWGGLTALKLEQLSNGWRIVVEDSRKGGNRSLEAQNVILAMDSPSAERLLLNSPDIAENAKSKIFPKGLQNAVVRLWFSESPREGTIGGMMTGDFSPDNFFWLHRLYPDYRDWHQQTGGSVIELHYYEDRLLEMPDRNLVVESVTEVQRAFPKVKNSFVHSTVRRNSKTQTNFRIPTDETLHVITEWKNLFACGDWLRYETPAFWMERSTITGIAAANEVLKAFDKEPYEIIQPAKAEITARAIGAIVGLGRNILGPIISRILRLFRRRDN